MKLDEFIAEALVSITNGVERAQTQAVYWIAPGRTMGKPQTTPQLVKFEIAITVSKEAGGGISILSLGGANASASSESTNKISFEIPVHFNAPTERSENHDSIIKDVNDISGREQK